MQRVIETVEKAMEELNDKEFLEELVETEGDPIEKERQHKEHELHRSEKKAMELQKKKEIDEMVQQSKTEYLNQVTLKNKVKTVLTQSTKSVSRFPKTETKTTKIVSTKQ